METYMRQPWIVIPTYNEAGNVTPMGEALLALDIPNRRVLFVDDASPDGTGELIDVLHKRFPDRIFGLHRTGPKGLGHAYREGFRHVMERGASAIVQMDCDFSHQPKDVPRLLAALADADMALGSRYVPGGDIDPSWSPQRRALSSWGNWYARAVLGICALEDATGGFRAWRRSTLQGLGLHRIRSQGYIFQVEMAYVACQLGYRVVEIPIFFPDRKVGESKMNLKIKIEAALRVWEVRWRHRNLTQNKRSEGFDAKQAEE
jgi:dolichol-phosphate mannosyltransferase